MSIYASCCFFFSFCEECPRNEKSIQGKFFDDIDSFYYEKLVCFQTGFHVDEP